MGMPDKESQICYEPLSTLDMSLITVEGLILVRSDRNLSPATQKKLRVTEARVFRKKKYEKYSYLLEDFDAGRVYRENFIRCRKVGKSHVSLLIQEDKNQTYADLVAAYSSDRTIPFFAGLILLENMKASEKGVFHYYELMRDYCTVSEWLPRKVPCVPPVSYFKMNRSGHSSLAGLNDRYVLKTLREFCGNRDAAAAVLNMSRPTLTARLQSIGYLLPDGSVRPDFEQWYFQRLEEEAAPEAPVPENRPAGGVRPPAVKTDGQTVLTFSDFQIRSVFRSFGGDLKKTAEFLGLPPAVILERLETKNFAEDSEERRGPGGAA